MISILIVEPGPHPEFDVQILSLFPWRGWAMPPGRRLGEWAWTGRIA
jgi:hypothetical protein